MNKRQPIIYLLIILLIAAVFRLYGLANRGLYFPDETRYYRYTVEGCNILHKDGLKEAIKFAGNTFTAKPGHTLLGAIWMNLFGCSQYSALTMSAFFGVLTILLIFVMMRVFYGNTAAIVSALVLGMSTLHIYYSRSFMSHVDQTFFVVLAFYFYVSPLFYKKNIWLLRLLSGLLLGFAFTIHPTTTIYFFTFLISESILLFADRGPLFRNKILRFIFFFVGIGIAPLLFFIANKRYFTQLLWVINEAHNVIALRTSPPVPFILSRVTPRYEGFIFVIIAGISFVYFLYRIIKYRKPLDILIFLQSCGIFLYWEFLSDHERLSRQLVVVIPFVCMSIGVFIANLRFKDEKFSRIYKVIICYILMLSNSYYACRMYLGTKNHYNQLGRFIKEQKAIHILTTSQYFAETVDMLIPGLQVAVSWFSEKNEIGQAAKKGEFTLLVVYPGDWLSKPKFRFREKPIFIIKESMSSYFAEFYEDLCFSNRLGLLKYYNENPLAYSVAVYDIKTLLKKEF